MHQTINSLQQNNLPIINNDDQDQEHFNESQSTQNNLITNSTDQQSISLQSLTTGEWISPQTTKYQTSFKRYNLANDHWRQYSKLIPNYRNLSSNQFKDMLIKSIDMKDRPMMEPLLNRFPLLQSLQNRAELMCTMSRLKIEENYCKYVLDLLHTPSGIWLSEVSQNMLKENSLNWDHTKTKSNIENRQEFFRSKLISTQNKLEIHLQTSDTWYWSTENKSKPHLLNIISQGLQALIENSLCYLRLNFQQKTILLKFDLIDVHLVKTYYDLKPDEQQIHTFRKIWQLRLKSCKRAIHQKKNNQSLKVNTLVVTRAINQFPLDHALTLDAINPAMQTISYLRLNNIDQRAKQLMLFQNIIIDNDFF